MIRFVEIEPSLIGRLSLIGKLLFKKVIRIDSPFSYVQETVTIKETRDRLAMLIKRVNHD